MVRVIDRLSILSVCVLAVFSGCANDTGRIPPGPSSETFQGTTDPVEQQRPTLDPVVLQEVRTAGEANFDRVVFEFQSTAVPGYRVAYVDSPVYQCASGETVSVQGESRLVVRLSPAQAHTETGAVTIKEQERHLDLPILKEMEVLCDFEGEVSWVLGLSMRKPFRVLELAEPARLVVDIQR